jgi:hypothetical protein
VNCSERVQDSSGHAISNASKMTYLGATLAADGRMGSELSRRIGMAKGDFRYLSRVWRHSALTRKHKLEVFRSLVEARLLYGLSTACFVKADLRRLDGFQAKCLRIVLRIPPSHLSRISNESVRQRASWKPASILLRERQVQLLGKVIRSSSEDPMRAVSFIAGTLQPATTRYIRRVGRPRQEWINQVMPYFDQ